MSGPSGRAHRQRFAIVGKFLQAFERVLALLRREQFFDGHEKLHAMRANSGARPCSHASSHCCRRGAKSFALRVLSSSINSCWRRMRSWWRKRSTMGMGSSSAATLCSCSRVRLPVQSSIWLIIFFSRACLRSSRLPSSSCSFANLRLSFSNCFCTAKICSGVSVASISAASLLPRFAMVR